MDTLAYAIVVEEVSKACANMGVILSVNNSLVCDPIEKFGDAAQKKEFLEPLARGQKLGCFALTEPEAGSDAANQKTRAVRDGDRYRLTGEKIFITCGGAADVALVFAATDPEKKHRGISAFLVDTRSRGFDRSHHQVKLGVNASGTVEIYLNDVVVPAEHRLGQEGDGFRIAMATLDGGRIGIAAQAVGIAQSAFEAAVRYAGQRRVFGRPIGEFQALRFYIADMATELDAARLLTWRAAAAKDEAREGGRYTEEAAVAKLFAAEMAQRVTTKRSRSTAVTATRRNSRSSGISATPGSPDLRRNERNPAGGHLLRNLPRADGEEHAQHQDVPGPRRLDGADLREKGEKHLPLLKALVEEAIPGMELEEYVLITSTTVS
jgi:butyryl-CoA dehydrogenase